MVWSNICDFWGILDDWLFKELNAQTKRNNEGEYKTV